MSTRQPKSWAKSLFHLLASWLCRGIAIGGSLYCTRSVATPTRYSERWARDPQCAMAHWGVAMTRANSGNRALRRMLMGFCLKEMNLAMRIGGKTEQDILLLRRKFGL
jgi:hypothetical protein